MGGIKPQASPTYPLFFSLHQSHALDTPCWAPSTEPILFEDYLDFTSGYQDPPFTIPVCSNETPPCALFQANPLSSSGNLHNSVDEPGAYGSGSGSQSINWDFALFPNTDSGNLVADHSSLLSSSASSTALTTSLSSTPDLSLNYSPNWNHFSVPSSSGAQHYIGNDSQLLSGGPIPLTTTEAQLHSMAISTGMGNLHHGHFSSPMVKDHSSSGSSTGPPYRVSSSPEQSASSKPSSSKVGVLAPEPSKIEKRKANTMAARRYRQKRVDQMSTLESELKDVKTERDDLKVRCARLEGEVETLRALLQARQ
ncbi:hypothetical protein DE146DRAFT_681510 [Phaeosphaeria sp. MPI-PUGE-AT-0046c]|nr:hypothetical protein DE146DRAFT_681510 [Phaeosphaeria sp. MPI-PUGE-AT-0046c]